MLAVTLLAVATMWMSPGNVGSRVNSSTKLLLCVVSIIFITARHRPAIHGDIWMDRFQSHCLALSMSSVLESLFVDYLAKPTLHISWAPRVEQVDSTLRAFICFLTAGIIIKDFREVKRYNSLLMYATFEADSTRLLVLFIYVMIFGLTVSSTGSILWMLIPRKWQRRIIGEKDEPAEPAPPTKPSPEKTKLAELAVPLSPGNGEELGRRSVSSTSTTALPRINGIKNISTPSASPCAPRGGNPQHWGLPGTGPQYSACPTSDEALL